MNRQGIEDLSQRLTEEYGRMIQEMYLDHVVEDVSLSQTVNHFFYINIIGLAEKWNKEDKSIYDYMTTLIVGLHSLECQFSIVFVNQDDCFRVYIGSDSRHIENVKSMLCGVFPMIEFGKGSNEENYKILVLNQLRDPAKYSFGGYIKGNPAVVHEADDKPLSVVISGMGNRDWCISIYAFPERKVNTVIRHEVWMTKSSECSVLSSVSFSESYAEESLTYQKSYQQSRKYCGLVEQFIKNLDEALVNGEWNVTVNYSSDSISNAELLGSLLVSSYYGRESGPEPVHKIVNKGANVGLIEKQVYHNNYICNLNYPRYSNFVSSSELASFAAFPTKELYGLSIDDYAEFDVDRLDEGNLELGNIIDSGCVTGNIYKFDVNELNRHCLVAGLTGSGKTNTLKSLIYSASHDLGLPFLIVEPAKKEYWELYKLGFTELQIFSVGSNEKNSHKLCINPFERACYIDENGREYRVPIQTHIDFVYAAFKASFIMYTPMPYVLERAIYGIYEDVGWNIQDNTNANGEIYPTMEDLYFKIEEVVNSNGYDDKMKQDLIGSLQARINSMRLGTKGETLNVVKTFPLKNIFNGNVIIELEDIGDDDVKAFIISMILILLLEYRRQQKDSQLELRHLMVIEEAHRLLKNVQSGTGENADPRGAAVEFFCNLLAELRSKGQGFIVADQIPSKLAPDLIKNTNLKIVHRTVAEEERVLLGGSMHMTDEQIDYLASLKQGVAAVYSEGDNRPILVKSKYAGANEVDELKALDRESVLANTSKNITGYVDKSEYRVLTDRQNKMCRMCNRNCQKHFADILNALNPENYAAFAESINPYKTKKCKGSEIDYSVREFLSNEVDPSFAKDLQNRICVVNNLIVTWNLEDEYSKELIRYYKNLKEVSGGER